jgi:hypothetical protein
VSYLSPWFWQFVNYAIVLIALALRITAHKDGFEKNGDKNCRLWEKYVAIYSSLISDY